MATGVILTDDFDDPGNYVYDSNKIEVTGGVAKLRLLQTVQNFNEPFDSDVGFTYDSAKAEFSGGQVQQKDQRATGSLLYSNFSSGANATWSEGSSIGTLNGDATVSSGKLNLTSSNNNYLEYAGANNTPPAGTGCIRFTFTPNYSGAPASTKYLYASSNAQNNINNLIRIMQPSGTNLLRWDIYDSAGVSISTQQTGNTFVASAGVPVEIELNFDVTAGATRLFVGGSQVGGTSTATGTRSNSSTLMRIGKDYTNSLNSGVDGSIDDFVVFSAVQHTANYTPGEAIAQTKYASTNVDLPQFTHPLLGNIIAYISASSTPAGDPQYTISVGGGSYMYWNGSAWAVSDGTYAQSNSITVLSTNLPTLDANVTTTGIRIHFIDTNLQGIVADLTINYIGESAYPTDNPTIKPTSITNTNHIHDITALINSSGLDSIRVAILVDGVEKWWDSINWVPNSSSYANTNLVSDYTAGVLDALTVVDTARVVWYLHSDDGSTTPDIDSYTMEYIFAPPSVNEVKVFVYGYVKNVSGDILTGATVSAVPERFSSSSLDIQYPPEEVTTTIDPVDGSWTLGLVPSSTLDNTRYKFTFNISGRETEVYRFVEGTVLVSFEVLSAIA